MWCLRNVFVLPYSGKVWQGENLTNWFFLSLWRKKVLQINRSANRLFIVSTNLGGFSLANHRWFVKFAKLSPAKLSCYTVFLHTLSIKALVVGYGTLQWSFQISERLYLQLMWCSLTTVVNSTTLLFLSPDSWVHVYTYRHDH